MVPARGRRRLPFPEALGVGSGPLSGVGGSPATPARVFSPGAGADAPGAPRKETRRGRRGRRGDPAPSALGAPLGSRGAPLARARARARARGGGLSKQLKATTRGGEEDDDERVFSPPPFSSEGPSARESPREERCGQIARFAGRGQSVRPPLSSVVLGTVVVGTFVVGGGRGGGGAGNN